ncbi:MAG: hypothetical protein ACTSRB_12515 [Candidatus Helarchaeota archaeon]
MPATLQVSRADLHASDPGFLSRLDGRKPCWRAASRDPACGVPNRASGATSRGGKTSFASRGLRLAGIRRPPDSNWRSSAQGPRQEILSRTPLTHGQTRAAGRVTK